MVAKENGCFWKFRWYDENPAKQLQWIHDTLQSGDMLQVNGSPLIVMKKVIQSAPS